MGKHREKRKPKIRPEMDRLIRKGRPLKEIAVTRGVTVEATRRYILRTEQYSAWSDKRIPVVFKERQKKKRLRKRKKKERVSLLGTLEGIIVQKAGSNGLAAQRALYIMNSNHRNHYTFGDLFTFFKRYETAKKAGEYQSLEKLSEGLPWFFSVAQRLLNRVGKTPLRKRKIIPSTTKDKVLLKRAYQEVRGLSLPDIAYFLEKPYNFVYWRFRKYGAESGNKAVFPKAAGRVGRQPFQFYDASQIYQRQDQDEPLEDIISTHKKPDQVVQHILNHRPEIEATLIPALRKLFADDSIDKPYLDKDYLGK